MLYDQFSGTSRYNALTAKVTKRASKGFAMLASYTYARGLDDNDGDSELISQVQNDNNPRADYGVTDNSIAQRLSVSPIWQLPFGSGQAYLNRGGLVNGLVGGWEATAIITFQTGFPFTVLSPEDYSNTGLTSARPDRTCNGAGHQTLDAWFNTSCFSVTALSDALSNGTPRFGNSGRNILTGPGMEEWDVSLIKKTRINERFAIEFRAEFFNLFNHPNFGNPGSTIGTGTAGFITGAATPRDIQFGLKMTF